MSFSQMAKDELLKKDFTASTKTIKMVDATKRHAIRASLRQRFLRSGSVTDPNKDYHLEFSCRDLEEAGEVSKELAFFSLHPKTLLRGKGCAVYLKDAVEISDVLNIIGAHDALMVFENVRIRKEVSENVNRRVNFEAANIGRTVQASLRQTEDIRLIARTVGLSGLPEGLREIAEARLRDQDAPLSELAASLHPPIGKSGASHRMRKLTKIAAELRERGFAGEDM